MFDVNRDYMGERTIWMFWTESNEMSATRRSCVEQVREMNKDCNVYLVTHKEISELQEISELPNLHKGFQYLSAMFKSDYLRCYFMHHFGGGYSDIKRTSTSWLEYFNKIEDGEDLYAVGYREASANEVARLENCRLDPKESKYCRDFTLNEAGDAWSSEHVRTNWQKLIGNCSYICKKKTPFTQDWWNALNEKMDGYYEELKENPAKHPMDSWGDHGIHPKPDPPTKFPIPWAGICGNIFHPLTLKYTEYIDGSFPYPDLGGGYR